MDPALSPDGRRVVFTTYFQGQRQLYVMDVPDWSEIKRISAEQLARAPASAIADSTVSPALVDSAQPIEIVAANANASGPITTANDTTAAG